MSKKFNLRNFFSKRTKLPNFALSVFVTTFKMLIVLTLVLGFAGFGAVIGIATGFMEATPVLDIRRIEEQAESSFIYDKNDNLITTYHGIENRIWASVDVIPQVLKNAFIAIEDARFYHHNGIDIKRIAGSFVNNLLNESVQGGSTITQQLIKNTLLTPERSYRRKIQEAYLAIQLEGKYSKDEILEAYLNTIYLGNGNHGIKTAALDYFGKELDQLTLREAAVIAGTARSPARYNPRRNLHDPTRSPDIIFNRANLVLNAMLDNGLITKEEYSAARFGDKELAGEFADGFRVIRERTSQQLYDMPHFIEYVISDVATHLMSQNGWSGEEGRQQAMNLIREGGLHIYTTVDPELQFMAEEVVYTYEDFPAVASPNDSILRDARGNEVNQPQAAAVVIDHNTGEIRALIGGRTPPTGRFWLNRAKESWPIGSSIKPISLYAPFIEANYPGGIILENISAPIEGWDIGGGEWGYPSNFADDRSYTGPVTAREALARSFNTTAARAVFRITPDVSASALADLGITSELYIESKFPSNLSLGSDSLNMIEVTAAYAAIANEGVYIQPISFRRVLDRDGNEILNSANFQVQRQVFKESTAFIITEWLKEAVSPQGTGRRALFGDMPIAGKTGTNQDFKGVFFSGFTPHYTTSIWIGHDRLRPLQEATAGRFAAPLWRAIMEPAHEGLPADPFFESVPNDVVQIQVCGISGKLPKDDLCAEHLVTEWFPRGAVPTEVCDLHHSILVCRFSGKLLSPYCPPEHALQRSVLVIPPTSPFAQLTDEDLARHLPGAIRGGVEGLTDITEADYNNPAHLNLFCPLHTQEWVRGENQRMFWTEQAQTLVNEVRANMINPVYSVRLSSLDINRLNSAINSLQSSIEATIVPTPPETGPFLTQIPIFDEMLTRDSLNTLRFVSDEIFGTIRRAIEDEEAFFNFPPDSPNN